MGRRDTVRRVGEWLGVGIAESVIIKRGAAATIVAVIWWEGWKIPQTGKDVIARKNGLDRWPVAPAACRYPR
jgi:hypothetical protein